MNPESAPTALAALRIAIGSTAWLTPNLAGRMFGLDPAGNPQAPYLARLFAIRDLADTAAAFLGRRGGYLSTPVSLLLAAPALSAVGMGAIALQAGEQSEA